MKLVIDLQAIQTSNRHRGIGAYSMSLAKSMATEAANRGHDVRIVLSSKLPASIVKIRESFDGIIPQQAISVLSLPAKDDEDLKKLGDFYEVPKDDSGLLVDNMWGTKAAELVVAKYIENLKPDFVHVLIDGQIVKSGGSELALELENKGYENLS